MAQVNQAQIIVDFEVDREAVCISIRNLSDVPALRLRIKPSGPIIGANDKDLAQLNFFKEIPYFAPQKLIRLYVDEHAAFFEKLANTKINFIVAYEDESGKPIRHTIQHDLSIYKDAIILGS